MAVEISATPNPNALKFTVGQAVGGPKTFSAGEDAEDALAVALLGLDAVASIFMTADFVTLTKAPEGDWNVIAPKAQAILEERFG